MTRSSFVTLALFLLSAAMLGIIGCGYAPRKDPPIYTYDNIKVAEESARLHAKDIGGTYHQNLCCGSMEPLIHSGDWIVVADPAKVPFTDDLLGRPCIYKAKWNAEGFVLHRFISGNVKDGFIASGDGVKPDIARNGRDIHSEAGYRVMADEYYGRVEGIYKTKP